jgi:protein SCO1/2
LPFILAAIILVGAAYGGWKWWQVRQFERSRSENVFAAALAPPLTQFELTERSGEPFRSEEMRGRVWVVSFFFASCPGPCRILNGNIAALNTFPDLKEVTWVSITCDPDNDSVKILREYAESWHADPKRWLFCRADLDYLKRVARGMSLALHMRSHSDHAVVIDRTGTIRGMFDGTSRNECERLRVLLKECLAEEAPSNAGGDKTVTASADGASPRAVGVAADRSRQPAAEPAVVAR